MRIVAGEARGRRIKVPPGTSTRPTSDRVREALFSSLGDAIVGAGVLDLFAGSGALGLEALSRGAARVVLVERDRAAAAVAAGNLEAVGLAGAQLVRAEAARWCAAYRGPPFDLVLCDPPYALALADLWALLASLAAAGGLKTGTQVVVERSGRDPGSAEPPPAWLAENRRRSYGDTMLLYLTASGDPAPQG